MKKKLIIVASVVAVLALVAFAFVSLRDSKDINVVIKSEALSPVTNVRLSTAKENIAFQSLPAESVQQVVFQDTEDQYALTLEYSIGGMATSSSFYVEPGYRVDLIINDTGFRTSYVFE